jgi:hypothetical protein
VAGHGRASPLGSIGRDEFFEPMLGGRLEREE